MLVLIDRVFGGDVGCDLSSEFPRGCQEDHRMDHELAIDKKVADEDQEGREDPAVKPHNQHSGQVQSEGVELNRSNFVTHLHSYIHP